MNHIVRLAVLSVCIVVFGPVSAVADNGTEFVMPDLRVVAQGAMQGLLFPEG